MLLLFLFSYASWAVIDLKYFASKFPLLLLWPLSFTSPSLSLYLSLSLTNFHDYYHDLYFLRLPLSPFISLCLLQISIIIIMTFIF